MNQRNSIKNRNLTGNQYQNIRHKYYATYFPFGQGIPDVHRNYYKGLRFFVLVAIVSTASLFHAGCGTSANLLWSYKASNEFQKTISAKKIDQLEVKTSRGGITVSGYKENDILITTKIVVRAMSQSTANQLTDKISLSIDQTNNVLKISPKWPLFVNHDQFEVNLEINVPWQYAEGENRTEKDTTMQSALPTVKLRTSTASIKVADIRAVVDAETNTGHIKVSKICGSAKLRTRTAGIDIQDVTDSVNAETRTGHINVESVYGPVSLKTSTAEIKIKNVASNVKAETISGNIMVSSCKGHAEVSSRKGAVDMTVDAWDGTPVSASSQNNASTLRIQFFRADSEP